MKHTMIDIETLGTRPDAVILSIGAVYFNPQCEELGMHEACHMFPPVPEQEVEGRKVDGSTAAWWMRQSFEARQALLDGQRANTDTLDQMRMTLATIVEDADTLWANGPDFDLVILRDFMGPGYKWPFWKHSCVRTFKTRFDWALAGANISRGNAHDAIADCLYQARQVRTIYRALADKGVVLE